MSEISKPRTVPAKVAAIKGDLPQVADAVFTEMGGHEFYGKMFAEDMMRIRDNTTIKEVNKERLLLSYHRQLQAMAHRKDQYELDSNELAGYSEDELKRMLRDSAMAAIQEDADFRKQFLGVVAEQDPEEIRNLLGIEVIEQEETGQPEDYEPQLEG